MIGLQRIWMLCLLVIAGSGPLPLWLHHAVCHGTAGHSHGCHGPVCPGHAQQTTIHSHSHASCCSHSHQVHAAKVGVAGKDGSPVSSWQAASDSHEDCAVCYTLSQLTTAQPTNDVLVSHLHSQYLLYAGDSQASLQTWLAYSSRGPPTV